MSSPNAPAESPPERPGVAVIAAPPDPADALVLPAQLALGVAYPFLAHLAATHGGRWAGLALADLVLFVLAAPLLHRRLWALALLAALLAGIVAVLGTPWPDVLLLAPPVLFTGWLAWFFGRSLKAGRTPLVTRIVAALYTRAGWPTPPELLAYARRLTAAWAGLLVFLTVANAVLAVIAVPGGVLHTLGYASPVTVSQAAWSWFANLLNYGVVGGFMVGEFFYRKRVFPRRPYRNGVQFVRQMAGLGPAFWRDLLR